MGNSLYSWIYWILQQCSMKVSKQMCFPLLNSEPGWGFFNITIFSFLFFFFLIFPSLHMSFSSISDHLAFLLLSVLHWPFNTIVCKGLLVSVKAPSFSLMSGPLPKDCFLFLAQPISSHLNQHPLQHINNPPPLSLLSHHFVLLCYSGLITHLCTWFSTYLRQHIWGTAVTTCRLHQACFIALPLSGLTALQQLISELGYSNHIAYFPV